MAFGDHFKFHHRAWAVVNADERQSSSGFHMLPPAIDGWSPRLLDLSVIITEAKLLLLFYLFACCFALLPLFVLPAETRIEGSDREAEENTILHLHVNFWRRRQGRRSILVIVGIKDLGQARLGLRSKAGLCRNDPAHVKRLPIIGVVLSHGLHDGIPFLLVIWRQHDSDADGSLVVRNW